MIVNAPIAGRAAIEAGVRYHHSALYLAVGCARTSATQALRAGGADPVTADSWESIALYAATICGHTASVPLLLFGGASPKEQILWDGPPYAVQRLPDLQQLPRHSSHAERESTRPVRVEQRWSSR